MAGKYKSVLKSIFLFLSGPAAFGQLTFSLPATPPVSGLSGFEYFFDQDPGFGNANFVPASLIAATSLPVNIQGMSNGVHPLGIRVRNQDGRWGLTYTSLTNIFTLLAVLPDAVGTGNIVQAEYFIDTDPGFGNGIAIAIPPDSIITALPIAVNIAGLSDGIHRLYCRGKDAQGNWSISYIHKFSVLLMNLAHLPASLPADSVSSLEYFFDTDPGWGSGTPVPVQAGTDISNFPIAADISTLPDGMHTFFVRTKNNWSLTAAKTFAKGTTLPVQWRSFTATLQHRSVLLDFTVIEDGNGKQYIIERSSDGRLFTEIGTLAANGPGQNREHTYRYPDDEPLPGRSYYRIRQIDKDGAASFSPVAQVWLKGGRNLYSFNNPAGQTLNIRWGEQVEQGTVRKCIIYGLSGQVLKETEQQYANSTIIDIADLADGMYLLKIQLQGYGETVPFLKQ